MSINAEALLASAGLTKFLAPGALRITAPMREAVERWASGELFRRELKKFLAGDAGEDVESPEFDYEETLERLTTPIDIDDIAGSVSGLDDADMALEFIVVASRAADYLSQLAPRRTRMTIVGPKPVPPDDMAVATFRRTYGAVNDPESVLAHLRAGSLTSKEAQAFAAVYPELFELLKTVLFTVLVEKAAKDESWEPSVRQDRLLQVLIQERTMPQAVVNGLQSAFTEAGANETGEKGPGPSGKPMKSIGDVQSSADRISLK